MSHPFDTYDDVLKATEEAMQAPQVGDRFHEMYSFWLYVVHIEGDQIVTMEGSPPVTFPEEGKVRVQTKEEFIKRFVSGKGYWVDLCDRGKDVSGWYSPTATQEVPNER